jgi:hypothetical protein
MWDVSNFEIELIKKLSSNENENILNKYVKYSSTKIVSIIVNLINMFWAKNIYDMQL